MNGILNENPPNSGGGSFGRVGSLICLLAAVAWVTHIVWHTHSLPALDGVIAWISAPFTISKALSTASHIFGPPKNGDGTVGK